MHNESRIDLPKFKDEIREWLMSYKNISIEDLSRLSCISIRKLRKWQITYDVIDIKDKAVFCAWYKYKKYSINEMATILHVNKTAVYYYTAQYGLREKNYEPFKHVKNRYTKTHANGTLDKSDLYDQEKFTKIHAKYGKRAISKMMDVSISVVRFYVKKYELNKPNRQNSEKHAYNNKKWLMEYYVDKGYSASKCAEITGTSLYLITEWLQSHGIKPRNKHEANMVLAHPEYSREFTHIS